jgi:hypothetical protein
MLPSLPLLPVPLFSHPPLPPLLLLLMLMLMLLLQAWQARRSPAGQQGWSCLHREPPGAGGDAAQRRQPCAAWCAGLPALHEAGLVPLQGQVQVWLLYWLRARLLLVFGWFFVT